MAIIILQLDEKDEGEDGRLHPLQIALGREESQGVARFSFAATVN